MCGFSAYSWSKPGLGSIEINTQHRHQTTTSLSESEKNYNDSPPRIKAPIPTPRFLVTSHPFLLGLCCCAWPGPLFNPWQALSLPPCKAFNSVASAAHDIKRTCQTDFQVRGSLFLPQGKFTKNLTNECKGLLGISFFGDISEIPKEIIGSAKGPWRLEPRWFFLVFFLRPSKRTSSSDASSTYNYLTADRSTGGNDVKHLILKTAANVNKTACNLRYTKLCLNVEFTKMDPAAKKNETSWFFRRRSPVFVHAVSAMSAGKSHHFFLHHRPTLAGKSGPKTGGWS